MADAAHRLRGLAAAVVLTATPLGLAAAAVHAGAPAVRASTGGTARLEDLLTAGSAVACAGVLGWLALVVGISAVAALRAGTRGSRATWWEQQLSPALVRRLVSTAVGLALGAGAGAAGAAAPSEPGWVSVASGSPSAERAVAGGHRELTPVSAPRTADTPRPGGVPAAVPPEWSGVPTGAGAADVPVSTVVVLRGDSLWSLVTAHLAGAGVDPSERVVAAEVQRWWATNRAVIGEDPDVLKPGQLLHVPARP